MAKSDPTQERIQHELDRRGWTYSDLAREIGVTKQAIYQIVRGITVGKTARYAVARALGVSVEYLWPEPQAVKDS